MDILIYTKHHCSYCVFAKKLLDSKNLSYTEINVQESKDMQASIEEMQKAGKGRTFPQIIIDGEGIGGYTELLIYLENLGG